MTPTVIVVPGLAVRSYADAAVSALSAAGIAALMEDPPAWRDRPADLGQYGQQLAQRIRAESGPVELLVGLSVGTQAAAVAAAHAEVRQLVLISPTVAPQFRTRRRLAAQFLRGEDHPDSPTWRSQIPDWRRAGARRILAGFESALGLPLEEVLPRVRSRGTRLTVVHADRDRLSPHAYAASVAAGFDGRLVVVPDAPHSWPVADPGRFVAFVQQVIGAPA